MDMLKKVALFLVEGFEEIEAISPIDLLKRAGINVDTVSITKDNKVLSARGIAIFTDKVIDELNFEEYDMIVLPGGPGTKNYFNSEILLNKIKEFSKNKKIGAICAAPTVLAKLGLLENIKATCFPACEEELVKYGALLEKVNVITDGNITTSKSAGTAIDFSLELIKVLIDRETAQKISESIYY